MAGLITEPGLCLKRACIYTTCFIHRLFKGRYRITEVDFVVRRPKDYQAQQWKHVLEYYICLHEYVKNYTNCIKKSGNYCFLVHTISIMEIIVSYTQIRN